VTAYGALQRDLGDVPARQGPIAYFRMHCRAAPQDTSWGLSASDDPDFGSQDSMASGTLAARDVSAEASFTGSSLRYWRLEIDGGLELRDVVYGVSNGPPADRYHADMLGQDPSVFHYPPQGTGS
jgi:hypothetical protein